MDTYALKGAILLRGDRKTRQAAEPGNNRYVRILSPFRTKRRLGSLDSLRNASKENECGERHQSAAGKWCKSLPRGPRWQMRKGQSLITGIVIIVGLSTGANAASLAVERTIALLDVGGRIDHLAINPDGTIVFVAEHDNNSLDAINLATGNALGRIANLSEPQGVAYVPETRQIVISNGGDGSVRFFNASTLAPAGSVALGADADNLRLDAGHHAVVVGYGDGGLAFIDSQRAELKRTIDLGSHPESFQLTPDGSRAYVNLPAAGQIGIADLKTGRAASFPTSGAAANFPMELEATSGLLAVAFRAPAKLGLINPQTEAVLSLIDICSDADDVFYDAKRSLLYVICGEGSVAVVQQAGDQLELVENVPTREGARTGLFVPALDRLFVAAPARNGESAQIMVLRPAPYAPSASPALGNPQSLPQQSASQGDLGRLVSGLVVDANTFWTKYFREHSGNGGYAAPETYTAPDIVAYTDQTQSGCGIADRTSGSFYCPRDSKIYLDMGGYQQLRNRFGASGDLSEAYVIAHEVGHHVQNLLGILPTFNKRRVTMSRDQADAYSAGIELQADCFGGLWARTDPQFSEGNIDEAISAANQVGDDMLTRNISSPRTDTHGTSVERSQWFKTGINSTDVEQCDTGIPKPWAYYQP